MIDLNTEGGVERGVERGIVVLVALDMEDLLQGWKRVSEQASKGSKDPRVVFCARLTVYLGISNLK